MLVKSKSLIVFLLLLFPSFLIGQIPNAIHYTVKDGLPSSTVYATAQDSKGFVWIGTEAGLARFDGAQFKVFTTQDGLPDNEVLGLLFDERTERLWVTTYCKAACYYRRGKFYTAKNDSSLKSIVCEFGEFINANKQKGYGVFLYNGGAIYECTKDRVIKIQMRVAPIFQIKKWTDSTFDFLCDSGALGYNIKSGRIQYEAFDKTSFLNKGVWIDSFLYRYMPGKVIQYQKLDKGDYVPIREIKLETSRNPTSVTQIGNKFFIGVAMDGIFVTENSLNAPVHRLWSGNVNEINADHSGNLWVTTNDDGLYVVKNSDLKNSSISNVLMRSNITALYIESNGTLFIGSSTGELFSMKNNILSPVLVKDKNSLEKIRGIRRYDTKVFCITNRSIMHLDLITKKIKTFQHISGGPKSLLLENNEKTILVGLLGSLMTINLVTDSFVENQKFRKRFIDMARHPDGRIFCGSLDGLYLYENENLNHIENEDLRLNSRITSLCFTQDSLLWIGTPANGVIVYNGKTVVANITQATYSGYHGTICRKVERGKRNEIWVATNMGVNKITYHYNDSLFVDMVTPLNMNDGLCSDDINDIQIQDSMIYVATSNGLTILNENRLALSVAAIPIYISSIRINDKDSFIHDDEYHLNYTQNNLRIEYVGVSLPSAAYLRYQYRLLGAGNDKWQTTSNTSIEFRSLSPGSYVFEAVVLDKFGNKSQSIARVKFQITPAFYMTVWFWTLIVLIILATGFYIIRGRFRRQQLRFQKEQGLNNKIIELEQQALKAQMNPHFIFNCLTSVQHFVNKEDIYSANMYLSNFAKLIRKTLDLSGEQYISLDKEVAYLQNYVQLEKMRFQEKFQYTITVDNDIDEFAIMIPPMLLQPIIENAIRHGLRNMDTDTGQLTISFKQAGTTLVCMIDDNGVGMERAKELKTRMHVEYQSKGMSLTTSRIQAINMISDKKITIEIKDKYDNNIASGTLVILSFEQ